MILAAVIFLFSLVTIAYAETKTIVLQVGDPTMTINGVKQELDPGRGTKPVIIGGRTLVPIAAIVQAMGGTIAWDGGARQVAISSGEKNITLTISSSEAVIEDRSAQTSVIATLDVAPQIINSRTMVPLRFVTERLGASVVWDDNSKLVAVSFGEGAVSKPAYHSAEWAHGQTGRTEVNSCVSCHNDTQVPVFEVPLGQDRIADFARENSFCNNCHMQRPHVGSWFPQHSTVTASKGMLNCLTCHDINQPGKNATGTYCNTCHWFKT